MGSVVLRYTELQKMGCVVFSWVDSCVGSTYAHCKSSVNNNKMQWAEYTEKWNIYLGHGRYKLHDTMDSDLQNNRMS